MATLYQEIAKYEHKNAPAIYFENKTITHIKLHQNIRKMITYLKEKGIENDDVVTVVLPNVPVTVYLLYALDAIGAKQNIIHPLTPLQGIYNAMEATSSKKLIVLETLYGENKEEFDKTPYQVFFVNPMYDHSLLMRKAFYFKYKGVKETKNLLKIDKFRRCKEYHGKVSTDDTKDSIYLHSGGTTGNPKIIALSDVSFNNLGAKIDGIVSSSLENKAMLAVLPTFHGFGLGMGIHAPLYKGVASALMLKFNSDKVIKWINQGKVNLIIGIPLLYKKLFENPKFVDSKLENLEYLFVGGDNVNPIMLKEYNKFFEDRGIDCKLLEGYGLTETVTVCAVNTKENEKIGSVGQPLRGVTMQIRDENLNLLKPGEIGEVFIAGDILMNGYYQNQELTKATKVTIDGKEWIKTGDLGYLDEDNFLYIKGRIKRLIKISGINVYPSEVENVVSEIEGVRHCALIYFEATRSMTLFLMKSLDTKKTDEELIEDCEKEIHNKFTKYAWPKKIKIVEEFPRTKVGKVDFKAFKDCD